MITRYILIGLLFLLNTYTYTYAFSFQEDQKITVHGLMGNYDGNFYSQSVLTDPFSDNLPSGEENYGFYNDLDGYDPNETDEPGIGVAPITGGTLSFIILLAFYILFIRIKQKI